MAGPPPRDLIDPVSPDDLRRAVLATLMEWWRPKLDDPTILGHRGYPAYAVVTMCRILYTIENGAVASKRQAAEWGRRTLGEPWAVLAFIRHTIELAASRNPGGPTE